MRWLGVPIVQLFAAHGARVVAGGPQPQTGIRPSKQEKRFLALLKPIDEPDRRRRPETSAGKHVPIQATPLSNSRCRLVA
jgi:hypothetical protein